MPASPCRTGTGGRVPPPRSPKRSPPVVSTSCPPATRGARTMRPPWWLPDPTTCPRRRRSSTSSGTAGLRWGVPRREPTWWLSSGSMHPPAETTTPRPHQAVLLVGGRGTRMWPLTAEIPKGLLPLAGLPFVEYQIRQLTAIGIEEIVLTVGRSLVEAWADFAAGSPEDVHVRLAIEDEPLETAGQIRAVLDSLDDRFFVLNGDVVLEADIAAVAAGAGEFGNLGLVEADDTGAYRVLLVGDRG